MSTRYLYGGDVALTFDSKKHRYEANGEPCPSVTQVTGTIAKPGLTWWASRCAADEFRSRVNPGEPVTLDELEIDEWAEAMRKAHHHDMKNKGGVGSRVHSWIEDYVKARIDDREPPSLPVAEELRSGAGRFLAWEAEHDLVYLASERRVYSRTYHYAGTLDILAYFNDRLSVIDVKTGSGVYDEHHAQTAAYVQALSEEDIEQANSINRVILHIPQAEDTTNTVLVDIQGQGFDEDLSAFLAALELHRWKRSA